MKRKPSLSAIVVCAAVAGIVVPMQMLSAQEARMNEARTTMRLSYGTVDNLQPAKLQSEAGSAALTGGIIGAAATHNKGNRARNAAAGALIGALIQKAAENRHKMDEITVLLTNGSRVRVIQDHLDGIAAGTCVSVEEGLHTNVRSVSGEFCNATQPADSAILVHRQTEAGACERAKEQLLDAKTEQEFEFVSRKIKLVCY